MSDDRTTPVPVWDVLYALRVFVTGECVIERSGPVLLTIEIIQGATFGETLRRLRKIVLSHRPRVDPLADREGCYSATHPSDHNSVSIDFRVRKQRREAWKVRWQRRRNRDGQKIKNTNGKAKNRDLEERHERSQDQDAAIMLPLPLMHGYGYPFESSEYPGLYVGVSPCLPMNLGRLRLT